MSFIKLQLKNELQILEEKRLQHLPLFIKTSDEELQQWWDKCYVEEDTKTAFFMALEKKDGAEEVLAHYEFNIKCWEQYYENHKDIFSKVDEWFKLWADRLGKLYDRFSARGHL